jgi:hypothetical protein
VAIALDDELKDLINGALMAGAPMIVASVDAEGRPRLSFRGSLAAFSDDQVGFWARNIEGSTLENIGANPHVAMMYRNPQTRVMMQLAGRARVAEGDDRDRVYDNAPEFERNADPERKGVAVIIDLDRAEGFLGMTPDGQRRLFRMER